MNQTNENIKKHYENKNSKSDLINLPINLRRTLLSTKDNVEKEKLAKAPITSVRIIYKCIEDVSYDQYYIDKDIKKTKDKDLKQMSLFEDEFLTENNNYVKFTFPINSITKTRDYEGVKKGLEFLENYKKDWYESKNKYGKNIKSYGGFIISPSISKSEITFLMSTYWYQKILVLSNGYNPTFTKTAWMFSNIKQVLFYLFLIEIPSGIKINYSTINDGYSLNYKNASDLANGFLKPIRKKLNSFSIKSFNYKVKGDYIYIVVYYPTKIDLNLKEETNEEQLVRQRLNYWKKRHKISINNFKRLEDCIKIDKQSFYLLDNAYKLMVKDYRIKDKKMTESIDNNFLTSFQEYIKVFYSKTSLGNIIKNGYPVL